MKIYCVIVSNDKKSYYGEYYDFPCFISGKNINELVEKAQKALYIYFNEMKLIGNKISEPTDLEIVKSKHLDDLIIPITIDDSINNNLHKKEKSIKKNVTIPNWLNELALKYEVPFSETLKTALIEEIKNKVV